jgi:hypothetical protein
VLAGKSGELQHGACAAVERDSSAQVSPNPRPEVPRSLLPDPQFQFAPFFFRSCFLSKRRDFFSSSRSPIPGHDILFFRCHPHAFFQRANFICGICILQRRDPGDGRARAVCTKHKTMQTPAGPRTFSCSPLPEGHRAAKSRRLSRQYMRVSCLFQPNAFLSNIASRRLNLFLLER